MNARWLPAIALLLLGAGVAWFLTQGGTGGAAPGSDGAEAYFVSSRLPDEEALAQRSISRWEGLISGDMQRAYLHATPAYRALYDLQHYQGQYAQQLNRERVDVLSVQVDPENASRAEVVVLIHFTTVSFDGDSLIELTSRIEETWLKEDGQWWYVEAR